MHAQFLIFAKRFSSYTDLSCDGDFKSDSFNLTDSHLKDCIDVRIAF